MKENIQELAATASTNVQGSSITSGYLNQPIEWLKEVMDAAKLRHYFLQVCYQTTVPEGNKDVVIPYRQAFMATTGTFADQTAQNTEVTTTVLSNLDGLQLTPTQHAYAVYISDYALRTNAFDLINVAKEELVYYAGDVVDQGVAAGIRDAGTATSSVRGAQELFGGDASSTATIESGDILTTDLIADAKTRLMSKTCKYWSGGSQASSSAAKNPWISEPGEPFVLFLSPEQENALLKDSQFVNAAEYGGNEIVLNGEIGRYLGVKVVVTDNTPASGDGGQCTGSDWGGGTDVDGHMCLIIKSRKCAAFAWGRQPDLQAFPFPSNLQTRIVLAMDYATDSFYDDAIVKIFVSDA